ncbi:MAG: lipoate--protein ligase family protein [Acaryochloridaceae cyanobacterium CSU_3_4]|nr:lipoate--protein ligase family protein [Acaryochloridaceae cyanobacterium CSU_3_4]
MAIDRWLFAQCCRGLMPPTLRFYTWTPAAISLGKNQRHWPNHWQDLTWQGQPVDLVRRPTGGRAVLHAGDLCYAIALSLPSTHRRQAYESLCQFLIQGWETLGIALQFGNAHRSDTHNPNCFGTATNADLVLRNGFKLVGSAQVWQGNTVLQHGSMRLRPYQDLVKQVFGVERCAEAEELPFIAQLPASVITAHLIQAVQSCFATEMDRQPLCPQEWREVQAFAQ